jgi:isoquinoline 1-oxidoreductase subunit alpha
MVALNVNGRTVDVQTEPSTPLLWAIREHLKLTGTKYGCGVAQCGACTVHIDGQPQRSCQITVGQAAGKAVTTIEALATGVGAKLVSAWVAEQAPQCGYCQSGQIMAAAALLAKAPKPTRAQIVEAMDGNICRCGSYTQIIAAIERVAKEG